MSQRPAWRNQRMSPHELTCAACSSSRTRASLCLWLCLGGGGRRQSKGQLSERRGHLRQARQWQQAQPVCLLATASPLEPFWTASLSQALPAPLHATHHLARRSQPSAAANGGSRQGTFARKVSRRLGKHQRRSPVPSCCELYTPVDPHPCTRLACLRAVFMFENASSLSAVRISICGGGGAEPVHEARCGGLVSMLLCESAPLLMHAAQRSTACLAVGRRQVGLRLLQVHRSRLVLHTLGSSGRPNMRGFLGEDVSRNR